MKRRLGSIVLAIVMVLSIVNGYTPKKVIAMTTSVVPQGYTAINSIADLALMRSNPRGNYILMNDIDLTNATKRGGSLDTGNGWVPIKNFSGTLDGNGHYIKGMHIYGTVGDDDNSAVIGLFGVATYGKVTNLGLIDVDIDVQCVAPSSVTAGYTMIGAIAAEGATVEECFVSGSIKVKSNDVTKVAGIVGYQGEVSNSYNLAEISAVKKDGTSKVSSCSGITNAEVFDRWTSYGTANYCYNMGKINNGEGAAIIYDWSEKDSGYNSFYLKGTGSSDGKGTPLTDTQMKNKNYYTNFDFSTVWDIDPYHNYLYPQLRNCPQVRIKQLSIVKQPDQLVYNQGDKISLSGGEVQITYEDGFQATVSMDDSMLGTYDMMQLGTQNITISKSGASDSFSITVNEIPVSAVTMSKTELVMEKGDTEDLTAAISPENATKKDVVWSSSDDSVVTVDQRGKVRAVSLGKAVVTAKSANGVEGKCEISVIIPCNSIKITNKGSYSYTEGTYVTQINAGSTHTFKYELNPVGSTEKVKWTSADPAIATVDGNGTVTGIKAGTTRITAETQTGQKDSVYVTVKAVAKKSSQTANRKANKNVLGKAKIKSIKATRKKLTVKWAKVKKAEYYEVQFATNRSFTKGKDSYEEWGTKMRFKGKRKKTYFVRVRAVSESYDKTVRGKWSAVKKKKTK